MSPCMCLKPMRRRSTEHRRGSRLRRLGRSRRGHTPGSTTVVTTGRRTSKSRAGGSAGTWVSAWKRASVAPASPWEPAAAARWAREGIRRPGSRRASLLRCMSSTRGRWSGARPVESSSQNLSADLLCLVKARLLKRRRLPRNRLKRKFAAVVSVPPMAADWPLDAVIEMAVLLLHDAGASRVAEDPSRAGVRRRVVREMKARAKRAWPSASLSPRTPSGHA